MVFLELKIGSYMVVLACI